MTAVERAAVAAGLDSLGRTRQADFLAALGAGDILVGLQSSLTTTLEAYLEARSAVVRMLDPRATGAFVVLAFGRGLGEKPPLRGFGGAAPQRGPAIELARATAVSRRLVANASDTATCVPPGRSDHGHRGLSACAPERERSERGWP